jgi:predicted dehydrogenase
MVNFAIIGTGVIASQHALGILANKDAQLVAVCDMNGQRAAAFAAEYKIEKVYTDYHEALADPNIHAVSICTPSGTHGEICMAAAKAGKHILCEKPIETKADKIDALIEEVEKNGVKMECVYQRRFEPIPQKVKAALDSGVFGKVLMASAYLKYYRSVDYYKSSGWRATWEFDGGGCLMNQGVHGVDLIAWLMGGVKKVSAMTRTQLHSIEVEDAAVAAVEYNNGAIGVIEGSTCAQPAQNTRFEIHCENGTICFGDAGIIQWYLNGEEVKFEDDAPKATAANDDPTKMLSNNHGVLVDELVHCIETDTEPSIGPREARKAVDTILAIYQSSREGREVLV